MKSMFIKTIAAVRQYEKKFNNFFKSLVTTDNVTTFFRTCQFPFSFFY